MGYAARYSNDIKADFERGYSFSGWGVQAQPTLEALVQELADISFVKYSEFEKMESGRKSAEAVLEDAEIDYAWYEAQGESGGYLPIENGLCAFYGETEEEAVEAALSDERFSDQTLYVFEAEYFNEDKSDSQTYGMAIAIVRPTGPAHKVSE